MALSGHAGQRVLWPLSGVKRTRRRVIGMAAFDPKRTWTPSFAVTEVTHIAMGLTYFHFETRSNSARHRAIG